MCGFCGFTGQIASPEEILESMKNKIIHRGLTVTVPIWMTALPWAFAVSALWIWRAQSAHL